MNRRSLLPAIVVATLCAAASAQTESPVLTPAAPADASRVAAPKSQRVISPEAAAALAAGRPKFNPPPPKPVEVVPEEELPDLRELDKPKNNIIRLPKYVVREPKPPVFTEREINTKAGLTKIAVKRYISEVDRALNGYSLPIFGMSTEARAMAQYEADERLKNMADLKDVARETSRVNKAESSYLKKETDQTYLRSSEFGLYGNGARK